MATDFLTASVEASKALAVARARHEQATARADARLATARDRHRQELDSAASIEAAAWAVLMAVPGMTVTTAARIAGTSESVATRWVARGRKETSTCT